MGRAPLGRAQLGDRGLHLAPALQCCDVALNLGLSGVLSRDGRGSQTVALDQPLRGANGMGSSDLAHFFLLPKPARDTWAA